MGRFTRYTLADLFISEEKNNSSYRRIKRLMKNNLKKRFKYREDLETEIARIDYESARDRKDACHRLLELEKEFLKEETAYKSALEDLAATNS